MRIRIGDKVGGRATVGHTISGIVMSIDNGIAVVHDISGRRFNAVVKYLFLWSQRPMPERKKESGHMRLRQIQRME